MVEHCAITGKQAHATGARAAKVARNMKRFGKSVGVYRCPHCDLWHVGRSRQMLKKKRPRYRESAADAG